MDWNSQVVTENAKETQKFGQKLAASLVEQRGEDGTFSSAVPHIICLSGELGSGKTTFLQGFGKGLGITTRLLSPTFIIVRRYDIPERNGFFYHIDLYRMKGKEMLKSLGLPDIFSDRHSIVAVEWAERLGADIPQKRLDITFTVVGEVKRKIITKVNN